MLVQVVAQPAKRVAAVPHRGPYNTIGEAFARLDGIARSEGWHDTPAQVAPADLRTDLYLPVD